MLRGKSEGDVPSILERVQQVVSGSWSSTSAPTATHRRNLELASASFEKALGTLRALDAEMQGLERDAEAAGAPWTPGRIPSWRPEP